MKLKHKTEDAPSSYGGHGVRTTPGDVVDVDDEDGEAMLETGYFERSDEDVTTDANTGETEAAPVADPPFDPTSMTVEEIREELTETDYSDAEHEALADAELAGDNRDGAIDLLSPSPPK